MLNIRLPKAVGLDLCLMLSTLSIGVVLVAKNTLVEGFRSRGQEHVIDCSDKAIPSVSGESVVASIQPQENCRFNEYSELTPAAAGEERDFWALCTFIAKEVKDFDFYITPEVAESFLISRQDKRVSYNDTDFTLVHHEGQCKYRKQARMRIPARTHANVSCVATFGSLAVERSNDAIVRKIFQPCMPELDPRLVSLPTSPSIHLGRPLTLNCWAMVGTGGTLAWAILTRHGVGYITDYHPRSCMQGNITCTIEGEIDETDPWKGPQVKSSLTIEKPRLLTGARFACLAYWPESSASARSIMENSSSPHAVVWGPIQIQYPSFDPVLLIDYNELPSTLYVNSTVTATCSARLGRHSKEGYLEWVLLMGGRDYEWRVTANGVITPQNTQGIYLGEEITFTDVIKRNSHQGFLSTKFSLRVKATFQDGFLECRHRGKQGRTKRVRKLFIVKFPPKIPVISSKYCTVSQKPAIEIKCSSVVGTNGSLIWRLQRPGRQDVTWGYDVRGQMFGSPLEGVMLHKVKNDMTRLGPLVETGATFKLNFEVDNARVRCVSTLGRSIGTSYHNMVSDPADITVTGAVKHFHKDWPPGSHAYKVLGWSIGSILFLILTGMVVSDVVNALCPHLGDDISDVDPAESRRASMVSKVSNMTEISEKDSNDTSVETQLGFYIFHY